MPLIQCPACQHKVSKQASSCPNCGDPLKRGLSRDVPGGCLGGCLIILVLLVVIPGMIASSSRATPPQVASTPQPPPQPKTTPKPPKVEKSEPASEKQKREWAEQARRDNEVAGVQEETGREETERKPAAEEAAPTTPEASGVSKASFDSLRSGMSYAQAVKIIGSDGEVMSSTDIGGIETVMYVWKNWDGSNMNAMFQNDAMVSKAQFGLR